MATVNETKKTYKAIIDLAFEYENKREKIDSANIAYLMIESNYEKNVLPVIYLSLSVDSVLFSKMLKYKNTSGKIYLNIKKKNANSKTSLAKSIMSGKFTYVMSNNDPNYFSDLNNVSPDSYKRIMIGLVDSEMLNKSRENYDGIYQNIDQNTFIALALSNLGKTIVEQLKYNELYDQIIIPGIQSRYKLIEYIFDMNNFYDTNFRFFMDFDRSYLLSKEGNAVHTDGELDNIIINIKQVTAKESYYDGLEIKNGAYYMYVNSNNVRNTYDDGSDKIANEIISVDEDEDTYSTNLNINKSENSTSKKIYVRDSNGALLKNELEENSMIIELIKQHIDPSIFTLNKSILINNSNEPDKNGKYIMAYKREFFKGASGEFIITCNIGLKRVSDIKTSDEKGNDKFTSKASSKSAVKKKSSSKKNVYDSKKKNSQ